MNKHIKEILESQNYFSLTEAGEDINEIEKPEQMTSKERRASFDDDWMLEMCDYKIKEHEEEIKALFEERQSLMDESTSCEDKLDWFYNMWIDDIDTKIKSERSNKYKWGVRRQQIMGTFEPNSQNFDIDAIKTISIESVMQTPPVKYGTDKVWYSSPLRNDNNPSFCVYLNTNTWYDWGRGESGDVISLFMGMNDVNFVDACRHLSTMV